MSKVLENNGYKMKVRNDRGDMLLIAQRVYTEQGVSYRGKPFYKGMVWYFTAGLEAVRSPSTA